MSQKSPRAPQLDLETALDRARVILEKEKLNEIPVDSAAKALGYKSANNGAAMTALATLRYYGLIERTSPGRVQVAKDVQRYVLAPDQSIRRELLREWLHKPQIFADLIERYGSDLPSDSTMLYELVDERRFNPSSAEAVITVFRRSVDFVGPETYAPQEPGGATVRPAPDGADETRPDDSGLTAIEVPAPSAPPPPPREILDADHDRIPVRLSKGRRAWLEIPHLFLEEDKERLKAQIDAILVDPDDPSGSSNR